MRMRRKKKKGEEEEEESSGTQNQSVFESESVSEDWLRTREGKVKRVVARMVY